MTEADLKIKAELLMKVFVKHPPAIMKEKAFALMQKTKPNSNEFKAYAALYEYCTVFC